MKNIENQYKIEQLNNYKMLYHADFECDDRNNDDFFEMQNLIESEIEQVVERLIFDEILEIYPN